MMPAPRFFVRQMSRPATSAAGRRQVHSGLPSTSGTTSAANTLTGTNFWKLSQKGGSRPQRSQLGPRIALGRRRGRAGLDEGTARTAQKVEQITGEPVQLLETLAGRIADQVMADERVERCLVRVHKPQAPIRQHFADVSVSLNRSRGEGGHG